MPAQDKGASRSDGNAPEAALMDRFLDQATAGLDDDEEEEQGSDEEALLDDEEEEVESDDEDETGDDDDEEEDEDEPLKPAARTETVADDAVVFVVENPDGTTQEITKREARAGYMRHADYTKKRMAEAETARERTAERDAFKQAVGEYKAALDTVYKRDFSDVDWKKLRDEDPQEYLLQQAALRELEDARAAEQAKLEVIRQQERDDARKRLMEYVEQQEKVLLDVLPHWKDRKVAAQEIAVIRNFLRSRGFTDEEIGEARDARLIQVVRDAALYAQNRSKASKPTRPKPKGRTLRPGAAPERGGKAVGRGKAFRRLSQTGSIRDAAAFFEKTPLLGDL